MFKLSKKAQVSLSAGESFVGFMVGVGLFGMPYAFAQAGFFVGMLYLLVIAVIMMTLQMMYAEVVLQTPGRHHLVGYVRKYFGKRWASGATLIALGANWGAMIAYILIGGEFFHALLSPYIGGSVTVYQAIFLLVGYLFIIGGVRFIARIETYLTSTLLVILLLIIVRGSLSIDVSNLFTYSASNVLLPYGVVLFSISGIGVIPEVKSIMGRYRNNMRTVIIWSTLTVTALYGLFALAVVGATGGATTVDAITGLGEVIGSWILVAGAVMGFLAVATSFLMMGIETQESLELDYKFTRLLSWFITMIVPLVVFLIGARNFIDVIGFTGGVFVGTMGLIVLALYHHVCKKGRKKKKAPGFHVPTIVSIGVVTVFLLGIVLELVRPFIDAL